MIRISEILKLSKDNLVKRNQTGVEMAQSITDLYRTRPNTEWLEFFNQLGKLKIYKKNNL